MLRLTLKSKQSDEMYNPLMNTNSLTLYVYITNEVYQVFLYPVPFNFLILYSPNLFL